MELVYLWVEEYKNIKNEGFNFSPRFECEFKDEYDNDDKLKDNCELVVKPKEHLDNFFDNDGKINITAIVGENGSGKSSILELLIQLSYEDDIKDIGSFLYLLKDGNGYRCFSYDLKIISKEKSISYENKPLYSDTLDSVWNHDAIKIAIHQYLNIAYINISHFERDKIIKNDAQQDKDKMIYLGVYSKNDFYNNKQNTPTASFTDFKPSNFNLMQIQRVINLIKMPKYNELIFKYLNIKSIYSLSVDYDKNELETYLKRIVNDENLSITSNDTDKLISYLQEDNFIIDSDIYNDLFKIINLIFKGQRVLPFTFTINSSSSTPIQLSGGENTILFYIEKFALLCDIIDNKKDTILLFDEIELYLHPNWQKKILSIILDIFKIENIDRIIHIILTSHSPFIISDLPKENVIFLKDGKQEYPFQDKQTFGANIHTLLSHGFFMDDGLIGEFAKGKITEIKKFYEKVNKSKNPRDNYRQEYTENIKSFNYIKSIIGEPFLQTIIKNYLDELEILFNGKNQFLDNEIKRLQALKDN